MRPFVFFCDFFAFIAPLAQLDRVPVFGTGGSGSNPARGIFFEKFATQAGKLLFENFFKSIFQFYSAQKIRLSADFYFGRN